MEDRRENVCARRGRAFFLPVGSMLCAGSLACPRSTDSAGPPPDAGALLRPVRVLIASGADSVRLRTDDEIQVSDDHGRSLTVRPDRGGLLVAPDGEHGIRLADRIFRSMRLTLRPPPPRVFQLETRRDGEWGAPARYAGELTAVCNGNGGLELINTVDVEAYVVGVVAYEAWPTFHDEALRAQAIASRSFVLDQMARRNGADFDVAATQGSQVYGGIRGDELGRRARRAAQATRGLVCTWWDGQQERLFPTFYSAACGGMSQSASIFGERYALEPLGGGVPCDYCRIGPSGTYRWGPVRVSLASVEERLKARDPAFAALGAVTGIGVVKRTPDGRPVTLRIVGAGGKSLELLAERFRHAVDPNLIRSTHFTIRLVDNDVELREGRGFGHGVGLCQWGMEGQAREGRTAPQILRYYYPQSRIRRAY